MLFPSLSQTPRLQYLCFHSRERERERELLPSAPMALPFPAPPPPWAPLTAAHHPVAPSLSSGAGDESPSKKKVKLLCSYGGQILPRPGDGALRYAGGDSRIVSVPKGVSFPDLMLKMAEACGIAGPLALKYQLPNEGLDALISVSCAEDLENMIEEYDKLAADHPDGSLKLRVFLFSPNDPAYPYLATNLDDTGQRYIEALNGIPVAEGSSPGSAQIRGSITSTASSTHSEPQITVDTTDSYTEGTSPSLQSPTLASSHLGVNAPAIAPSVVAQTLSSPWLEPPTPVAAPYVHQQAYIDPHQVQYINPQQLGMVGGPPLINVVPFKPYTYLPAGFQITTAPPITQVGSVKPVQAMADPNLDDNLYGGRVVQPLSQLPPLPPAYLQPHNMHGLNQGQMLKLEDCLMCQKALPHAHSDNLVQQHGMGSPGGANPVFYSHHSEKTVNLGDPQLVSGALADNLVNLGDGQLVTGALADNATGQLGAHGFSQIAQYDRERPILQKTDNIVESGFGFLPDSMGFSGDTQSPHGVFLGNLQQSHVDPLQQHQQAWQNWGSPQYRVMQDMFTNPLGIDASSIRNENLQAPQTLVQDTSPEFSYNYARPIGRMMEELRVSPPETSVYNEQWKAVAKPNSSPVVVGNGNDLRPQVTADGVLSSSGFANSEIVPEGDFTNLINQLPPTSMDVAHMQNLEPSDTSQMPSMVGNPGPFSPNLGLEFEHLVTNERLLGMPEYSFCTDSAYNDRTINNFPIGDCKDEASHLHANDMLNNIPAAQHGDILFQLSNATVPIGHVETSQEQFISESLFSNEDPWKILGDAHLLPPKPSWIANKQSVISKDSPIENHLRKRNDSDIVALLEEGALHHLPDPLNKDLSPEPDQSTKGSAEEHIKQEMQAVAEGVAALVLRSSTPPVPIFSLHETKENNPELNKERGVIDDSAESHSAVPIVDRKLEDIKPKFSDKMNPGVQITEDIGRLQIIKNSDLEELRELGSGTFGTVYHGKWRGSDVAIKRINDRCFAGKPSEEERMRADFWNEACKLADLHHPNVVAFYGVVLDGPGGCVATVTEYMVNGSLRNALQRNDKAFDQRKRLLIAMDVAFGMEYLHGKNIVHFDLKSDNLLVNLRDPQRPICKVGDLGLSKVKCQTLISGGVRGTLPWMAPELLNGSSSLVSEKVDVFSFGIVMWELLTREEPYADLHYGAIIGGIVSNTLRPPVPESCDYHWRSLMERCWSSEPAERPSFTEVANGLRTMAASPPKKGKASQVEKKGQTP